MPPGVSSSHWAAFAFISEPKNPPNAAFACACDVKGTLLPSSALHHLQEDPALNLWGQIRHRETRIDFALRREVLRRQEDILSAAAAHRLRRSRSRSRLLAEPTQLTETSEQQLGIRGVVGHGYNSNSVSS